jgi:nucleoside recognition membrane protein YjiH
VYVGRPRGLVAVWEVDVRIPTRRNVSVAVGLLVIAATAAQPAVAQTTATYHLHKELSLINSANKQLKSAGPDATQTALQTANLKGSAGNFSSPIAVVPTEIFAAF